MPSVFSVLSSELFGNIYDSFVTTTYLTEFKLTVGSGDSGLIPVSCVGTILFSLVVAQFLYIVKAINFDSTHSALR